MNTDHIHPGSHNICVTINFRLVSPTIAGSNKKCCPASLAK